MPVPGNEAYRFGFFAGDGGATLFEQSWYPYNAAKARVVVVHGLYDHSSRYAGLAATLVEHDIAVHSYDLRGNGHSEGVRGEFPLEEHVADLAIYLQRARRRKDGASPLFVLGVGEGSIIALTHASLAREALAGLVAAAPAPRPSTATVAERLLAILRPGSRLPWCDIGTLQRRATGDADDSLICAERLSRRAALQILDGFQDALSLVSHLRTPLLTLQGGADTISDPRYASLLHKAAGCADKSMRIYAGMGHDLFHEPGRDRAIGDVLAWVVRGNSFQHS